MKKSLLLTLAGGLLLASCSLGQSSSKSSASSSSSAEGDPSSSASGSQYGPDDSSASSGSSSTGGSVTSDPHGDPSSSSSSQGGETTGFPEKELREYLSSKGVEGVAFPTFEAPLGMDYGIDESEEGECFYVTGFFADELSAEDACDTYFAELEDLDYEILTDYLEEYGIYVSYDPTESLGIQFGVFADEEDIVFEVAFFPLGGETEIEESSIFPSKEISSFLLQYAGAEAEVPAYEASVYYHALVPSYGAYMVYSLYDSSLEASQVKAEYIKTLEGLDFILDDSGAADGYGVYADDPEGRFYLQFEAISDEEGNAFMLYVFPAENGGDTEFPSGEIEEFLASYEIEGVYVPAYPADNYTGADYWFMYIVESSFDDLEEVSKAVEDYTKILDKAGYEIDEYFTDEFEGLALDPSKQVQLTYFIAEPEEGDGYLFELYVAAYYPEEYSFTQSEKFPSTEATAFGQEMGVEGYELPAYEANNFYFETVIDEDYEEFYFHLRTIGTNEAEVMALEDAYLDILSGLDYVIDTTQYVEYGYLATDPAGVASLQFYAYKEYFGDFYFDIYLSFGEVGPNLTGEETFDEAVPGETSVISFEDYSFLVAADEEGAAAIWNNGAFSFRVDQGDASVTVGNNDFFCDPLRLYAKQEISIYSETPIESISFEVNEAASKSKLANLLAASVSAGSFDNKGTLTLPEDTYEVTITLPSSGQVHLDSVSVTFAA